jgi:hypothetical protein
MLRYKSIASSILPILFLASVGQASIIVNASVSGSPGAYSYSYQIDNQTAVNVLSFSLTVTSDVGTVQSPPGWVVGTGVPSPGQLVVQWVSTDTLFDVPAFGTLSGFSIASSAGPGTVAFSTLDNNFSQFDGQTTGPVIIPEPGSLLLVGGAALAGLLAFVVRLNKYQSVQGSILCSNFLEELFKKERSRRRYQPSVEPKHPDPPRKMRQRVG